MQKNPDAIHVEAHEAPLFATPKSRSMSSRSSEGGGKDEKARDAENEHCGGFDLPNLYHQSDIVHGEAIGHFVPLIPNAGTSPSTADPVSLHFFAGLMSRMAKGQGIDPFLAHMVEAFVRRQIQHT